jgi:hypothetical protein
MIHQIIPATRDHAISMAPNMRAAEVREVFDSLGRAPEEALLFELDQSATAWAWIVDGEVATMFGIVTPTLLDLNSYPWLLTTPLVETHARAFARGCRTHLPELLAHHPRLVGMVDSRYALSVRWLEWLGAQIDPARPHGPAQALFHPFTIGA